jgi:lipopolysaccharide heptosyltransferase II
LYLKKLIIGFLRHFARNRVAKEAFLVSAYGGLGNFIMATPMVKKLRQLYPAAKIYILAGNPFGTERVLRSGEIVDDVLFLPTNASILRKALFFLRLRRKRIRTAFVPFDAAPAFYWWGILLAGIPQRVGHTLDVLGQEMSWTRDVLTEGVPLRLDTHESDLHFDLLERIHGRFVRDYDTHVAALAEDILGKFNLKAHGYVMIQVSAANAGITPKRWVDESIAELIKRLQQAGETVVLPGDQNEKSVIDDFLTRHNINAVKIAGMTSIEEISTVIKHAKLLICHDSGLMHIGNAHKTPLIALYGPTDDVFTAPRASSSRMIRVGLPCAPCMKNFAKTEAEALRDCPINVQCMRDISIEEVYRLSKEMLAGFPASARRLAREFKHEAC